LHVFHALFLYGACVARDSACEEIFARCSSACPSAVESVGIVALSVLL
jgi:hypothetical protein